jgi:hypothetical protein
MQARIFPNEEKITKEAQAFREEISEFLEKGGM